MDSTVSKEELKQALNSAMVGDMIMMKGYRWPIQSEYQYQFETDSQNPASQIETLDLCHGVLSML